MSEIRGDALPPSYPGNDAPPDNFRLIMPEPSAPPEDFINEIKPEPSAPAENPQPNSPPQNLVEDLKFDSKADPINMPSASQSQSREPSDHASSKTASELKIEGKSISSTGLLMGKFYEDKSSASKALSQLKDGENMKEVPVNKNPSANVQIPEAKNKDMDNKPDDSKPRGPGRR
jgi:hypothetical protein